MGINKNFVVRNGLEVADSLVYADDNTTRVGINTDSPEYTLDVSGDVAISGALVSSANTSGVSGQYIISTGDGWDWETIPKSRESVRYTLVASQTLVPSSGDFGFVLDETDYALTSVYLDGVKLTQGDYVINSGGRSITLFAAAFGGEEIEVIGHSVVAVGAGNSGILGITVRKSGIASGTPSRIKTIDFVGLGVTLDGNSGLVTAYIDSGGLSDVSGDPSPNLGGYLDLSGYGIYGTGIVTATKFIGDGSELTGITTLIKAGSNVTITTFSGITTINASGGGSGTGYFDNDQTNAGIHTTASHVGLGTTNPRFQTEIGSVGAAGTQLWVNGDARITGILTVGSSSITIDGNNDEIRIGTSLTLTSDGSAQYTGVVTASGFDGDLVGQHKIYTAGVSNSDDYSIALFLDPTQGGHTYARYDLAQKIQYNPSTGKLSNVGIISATGLDITGVSTFSNNVTFQSNVSLGDNDILYFGNGNDLQISHTGSLSRIQETGNGGLELRANPSITLGKYSSGTMGVFNVDGSVDLYYNNNVKFATTGVGASVVGILSATTFIGNLTGNATGLTNGSYNLNTSGIITAATFVGDGSGLTGITAVGSGVEIQNNDLLVGVASTINFGSNLSVSAISNGICTITGTDTGILEVLEDTTPQLGGNLDLNSNDITGTGNVDITGIITATSFVGDGSQLTGIDAASGFFKNDQIKSGIHTTAEHVGLGTTNPRTPLQVENVYGVYTANGNFSATAGVTIDGDASWTIATDDFKTAEYTLWFQYGSDIQSQKVLVINDGTTAYSQEYAIMFNNDLLVSVGATISAGVCKLLWTPETGVTGIVTYRVVRETML